jgi:hypothetical protein
MPARECAPASAENFANFRQLPVFLARLLSEYQNQYFTPGVEVSESPQAIFSPRTVRIEKKMVPSPILPPPTEACLELIE